MQFLNLVSLKSIWIWCIWILRKLNLRTVNAFKNLYRLHLVHFAFNTWCILYSKYFDFKLNKRCYPCSKNMTLLTHLFSMHPFSTLWKHLKTVRCIRNKLVNNVLGVTLLSLFKTLFLRKFRAACFWNKYETCHVCWYKLWETWIQYILTICTFFRFRFTM